MTSTNIVDTTYSPTQSVVTFLTQTDTGLSSSQRVFDFEISSEAQNVYSTLMNELMTYSTLDTTNPQDYLKTVSNIFLALSNWSQMKNVSNGVQSSSPSIVIHISDPHLASILSTAFAGQTYSASNATAAVRGVSVFDSTTGNLTIDSTMTRYMAEKLDTLVRTLRAAGWDPVYTPYTDSSPSTLADKAINALFSVSGSTYTPATTYGVYDIIQRALDASSAAPLLTDSSTQSQSLQELLMVDYVVRGNELLYNEMDNLNTAINLNQTVLSYLNSLQDLLNQKDPQHFLLQLQALSNLDESSYSTFEEQTFGSQTLGTTAKFTDDELTQYVLNLKMKALGIDPTSASDIAKAQYGISDNYTNLMAVMDYNISKGLVNSTGSIVSGGLDPTTVAVQNQFCLSATDVATYENAIVPALAAWYSGTAQYTTPGYDTSNTTAFQAWFDDHRVQGYYGISSLTDTVINMISDGKASFTVGTNLLNASSTDLATYGLGPDAASLVGHLCAAQSVANPTLDRKALSKSFMSYFLGNVWDPDTSQYFTYFNSDGTPNPNHPCPMDLFGTTTNPYYATISDVVAKIAADGKSFTDATVQDQYGLTLKTTTGAVTSTGTAADAFVDTATNSFSASLEQIRTNLQNLINKATTIPGGDGSALVTQLNVILTDFKNVSTVSEWVQDYDTIGNEGNYQRHMNDAITASQAFNDTERENLRRVMFVYEEFYKSATAMLDKLNTIIEKMGSAIKG